MHALITASLKLCYKFNHTWLYCCGDYQLQCCPERCRRLWGTPSVTWTLTLEPIHSLKMYAPYSNL